MTVLFMIVGLFLLAIGGDILVRGAVGVASRLGISPLLAGLTIVGFGTSTPELVTSLFAAFEGAPGIAVGNVIGSNVANILLILGASALILPLAINPAGFRRDGLALVGATFACLIAVLLGYLSRPVGFALMALLVGYILWAYRSERRRPDAEAEMHEHVVAEVTIHGMSLIAALGLAIAGIIGTILGARLLVDGAIVIARDFGVTETVIGLTVVAVGTSLPELVACIIAALRRHPDVVLGNIIGSNIYNVLGILGVTAIVHPITIPPQIAAFDVWVLLGATALLGLFLRTGWTLKRWEGGVFLMLYAGYVWYLTV
ncbi:sodium:calcium antiporter [Sphingopyxis bauzanensis]|uniref:Sodium:calcium antiporter n=1 Tax=Sphingopyxis bauzanensis TaxID=651663 RepID=A0A246K0D8_9SPHN|nr:calcium/sodium antiporter [Sphingopyxis bauzanensis]OWQ98975.1 sodium:calcium antiporter [Sphingopyxis bauzanensis]GGJ64910.1 sodium:calcium antiporter [Sphingopyxis bauzanensis]